ncbi:MAG: GNAT family N-acetyltransferase [Thermoproteota archaeon]|nr:GNAT family N-acetyltransferase [Candidatus Brockarchaeota archaeon]
MSSPGIVFRKYRPGDEEGIASLLHSSFESFREYGINKEVWLEYGKIDSGFRPENALVAEYEGKVVGHVQVIYRRVKIGDNCYVDMGGIANVSTMPEMRRRGIGTTLLLNAIDQCVKKGIPLSGLFTSYGSTAHRMYKRVGYEDTFLCEALVGTVDEMKRVKDNCGEAKSVVIRHYEDGDEDKMLRTYLEWGKSYTGLVERSIEYWRRKLVERSAIHTFFYGDFDPEEVFIAVENGEVTGYAYTTLCKKKKVPFRPPEEGIIRELVFKPGCLKSLISLVDAIMDFFISEDVKLCEIASPLEDVYLTVFKPLRKMPQGMFMTHIPLIHKLFEELKSELENRLSLTPLLGGKIVMEFETPYGSIRLGVHGGEVNIPVDEEPTVRIFFDSNSFTRMVFGVETISDLITGNMVRIHTTQYIGRVVSIVQALFPRRIWFMSPIDHW